MYFTHNPQNLQLRSNTTEEGKKFISIREKVPNPNDPEDIDIHRWARVMEDGYAYFYEDKLQTPLKVFELVETILPNFDLLYQSLKL